MHRERLITLKFQLTFNLTKGQAQTEEEIKPVIAQ